jgi:hypothetical protein
MPGMGQLRVESRPSGQVGDWGGGGGASSVLSSFPVRSFACARARARPRQRGPAWGMLPCGSVVDIP